MISALPLLVAETPAYAITDLGALGQSAWACGVNHAGTVIGATLLGDDPDAERAFLHAEGLGMIELGTLGGSISQALGINDAGVVVGYSYAQNDSTIRAFVHDPEDGMSGLPDGTIANGINNDGWVVGTNGRAFVYAKDQGLREIGRIIGRKSSFASSINERGWIAGSFQADEAPLLRAFLYRGDVDVVELGVLPGGSMSVAQAINDSGCVVGFADAGGAYRAFLYTEEGEMMNLGANRARHSFACDINDHGQIVGYLSTDEATSAFVYQDGVMSDLNTLSAARESGWTLCEARAINNRGWIVGTGLLDGCRRPYLLTPSPRARRVTRRG